MTTISSIYNEICKYAKNDDATVEDRDKLIENIWDKLNTNKNTTLDNDDNINDYYKRYFGIDATKSLTKADLKNKIDNISTSIALSDEEAPTSDLKPSLVEEMMSEENGAYGCGYDVAQHLIGWTNDDEHDEVKSILKTVNKDNVKEFIKGYYANDTGGNGLFEQLGSEYGDAYKNADVVPVMRAVIESLSDDEKKTDEYKELLRICRKYERKDANKEFENCSWIHGLDRIFGCDELEKFDYALEKLWFSN